MIQKFKPRSIVRLLSSEKTMTLLKIATATIALFQALEQLQKTNKRIGF